MQIQRPSFPTRGVALIALLFILAAFAIFGQRARDANRPKSPIHGSVPPAFSYHVAPRSGHWPKVRATYLADHPNCEACGRSAKQSGQAIEVHHRLPFHDDESKELDPENLIALCRRCHELIGHLDSWKSYNPDVAEDAGRLLKKIKARPK